MKAFIIFRDRVTYARQCAAALAAAGLEVRVVDQGSSYPPAVAWLNGLEAAGEPVMRRGGGHPRGLWEWEPFRRAAGETGRYVVTDEDCVPDCPPGWLQRLGELLDAHPEYPKAGLGLRTGDIPAHYERREQVTAWEARFAAQPLGDGSYTADTDTTLALYRPLGEQPGFTVRALRTGEPWLARHLAWYEDYDRLTPEQEHYHEHAEPGISHWTLRGRSAWGD